MPDTVWLGVCQDCGSTTLLESRVADVPERLVGLDCSCCRKPTGWATAPYSELPKVPIRATIPGEMVSGTYPDDELLSRYGIDIEKHYDIRELEDGNFNVTQ